MIRAVTRLAIVGFVGGWIVDRVMRAIAVGPPAPVESLIVIEAPIKRVWSVVADIEGQPRWMTDMKAVRLTTRGRVGVGTRGEATVRMYGISVTDPITITEFEPPTRFAIRHEGIFGGTGLITLEPGADGSTTIVRWEERLTPPLFPHLGASAMAPMLGRIFQADLERLRRLIEA